MPEGYAGKILNVDLSQGKIENVIVEEKVYKDFIGGYGLGARVIFSRQKPGIDPLGPDNILGFVTGPLTGSPILFGTRYMVVGKSPLTGTWADSNSGGDFGPYLKFAGYDAVFFSGVSERPVYLFIDQGRAELRDAGHLWGKDTFETEDLLQAELGKETRVACIGQSGERLSLIAAVMNNKGRAAGRSGLGAVMGSKRLKAVAVRGGLSIAIADPTRAKQLRAKHLARLQDPKARVKTLLDCGTAGAAANMIRIGDTPVKNWTGIASVDFPNYEAISDTNVTKYQLKKYHCWRCPIGCGGHMKAGEGLYQYAAGAHKPEYETLGAFGAMCLNDNVESIIMANDICNRYGIDTISAGVTIAFAIECYEKGVVSGVDTGGIELTWGNHQAIVTMCQQLAKREGFGAVLADGVGVAAKKIGKGAEEYAIHIQGQEVPMHDPKCWPGWATSYKLGATPADHIEGAIDVVERGGMPQGLRFTKIEKFPYAGKGEAMRESSAFGHVFASAGLCLFGVAWGVVGEAEDLVESLKAVTGWDLTLGDILETGDRIANIRQAFNLREGLNPLEFKVPDRILGRPPLQTGPTAGVEVDLDTQVKDYLKAMDWGLETAKPSKRRLLELGLDDVADALWP